MEEHDFRVIEARAALAEARKRDPGELTPEELTEEIIRFRKYVRWLIDLADDAADTEIEEEVSQITIWGGVYIAPGDTRKLCDLCLSVLDSVWDTGVEQGAAVSQPPAPEDGLRPCEASIIGDRSPANAA
ncbi:MAG TPA: hypothetical protein VMC83_07495 [Streptosporangiaceae bacterium]|nr:hypothetical protein [Streptosporangiaceae bacterium]